MKRLITLATALCLTLSLLAQGNVTTRKYRYSDFTSKVTKVVLAGEDLLSGSLRQEVVSRWTVSAFEFCTAEEFEKLKTEDKYYFLLLEEQRYEDTPGIQFLSLVKGGVGEQGKLGEMDEVIALPVVASSGGTGRELVFMGALVQAVQDFTMAALESEKDAYRKTDWFNDNYRKYGKMMQIYLAEEDLNVAPAILGKYLDEDIHVVKADEADAVYLQAPYNTLVSYVIAPEEAEGAYCYKLLLEAESQKLYYLTRHKMTAKKGAGFLPEDLKKLKRKR